MLLNYENWLPFILHYSQASINLLSISYFSHDNNCYFLFDEFGFVAKDKKLKMTLYHLMIKNRFYFFHFFAKDVQVYSLAAHVSRRISINLWCHCLDHSSHNIQFSILSSLLISNNQNITLYPSCQLRKNKNIIILFIYFSSSISSWNNILWCLGAFPYSLYSNFSYYILFVDDFSYHSWLFSMRYKYNFFDIFISFLKYMLKIYLILKFKSSFSTWVNNSRIILLSIFYLYIA